MKRNILNVLFALVLVLSFSLVVAAPALAASPVDLGSASTFAVLAGSTVNNTGNTVVTGDLGLSPGTEVVGFLPGIVHGTIHAADEAAAQAQTDLTYAYTDAAGRTPFTTMTTIGDVTLTAGVYHSGAALALTGVLTLSGGPNDIWIFQAGSTLTTAAGSQVILSGGAQADNVYWAVGSSATLGENSIFKGNILASASITLYTGAAIEGRALAQTAAVTLDTNTIVIPPSVTSIDPTSGPGVGGTSVTITGTGFVSGATVTIGGNAATGVTFGSATSITAITPAGTAGAVNVVVTTPGGNGTLTNGYTYVAPTFTLTAPSDVTLGTGGALVLGVNTGFSAAEGSVVTNGAGWTLIVTDTSNGFMEITSGMHAGAALHNAIQVGMTSGILTTIPLYQDQLTAADGYGATGTFIIPLYASQTVVGTDAAGTYSITLTYTATPGGT